jgi:mono/diheme cytochrome c family protein
MSIYFNNFEKKLTMKKLNLFLSASVVGLMAFLFFSFAVPQQKTSKSWNVPDNYMKMKNPQAAGDAEMIKLGRMLYAKDCRACHGSTGKGDGVKAAQLDTPMIDFSTDAFHKQADGELYYKSFVGRDEMPNFEKKIVDEEERWAIITYMRASFK